MSNPEQYTIGWISALSTEFVAARSLFDKEHEALESTAHCDDNNYALGRIGKHNVVMAVLPKSAVGITSAATVASNMLRSFPNIRFGLMVGIGGGAPSAEHDIRLGDIVVNTRGVFQYDHGKEIQGRAFQTGGSLNKPPQLLLTAISALEAEYELKGHKLNERIETALQQYPRLRKKYSRPDSGTDRLYQSDIIHPDVPGECGDLCGSGSHSLMDRGQRDEQDDDPAIHYGMIASGNRLMKDAHVRDSLSSEKNVLCFEMEAAGLADHFPCVVIRGISDYSDSHKNDKWQGFSSMAAAAYAKDLLYQILPGKVQAEIPIKKVLTSIEETAIATRDTVMSMAYDQHNDNILRWLSPPDHSSNASLARKCRHPGTGNWFLNSPEFHDWKSGSRKYLWLYGLVGCGKTVLSTSILDYLLSSGKLNSLAFFFDFGDSQKLTLDGLLRSLAAQLYHTGKEAAKILESLFASYNNGKKQLESTTDLSACVNTMIEAAKEVFIVIDALDECTQWQQMLQWLERSTSNKARILVTGRPEEELKSGLIHLFTEQNCISLDKKAIDADIYCYVHTELEKRPDFVNKNLPQSLLDLVHDKIGNGADGMFRWAACQLDVLARCLSPRDIKTALESLPHDLDETYRRMIERIPPEKKSSAIRLLQFLVHTKRPLKLMEAVEVIATQIDQEPSGFNIDGRLFQPDHILRYCPSLIVITENLKWYGKFKELHLSHFSVKEYLLKQSKFDLRNASIVITRVCLAYLGDIDCTGGNRYDTQKLFPMARYAAEYWTEYAVLVEDCEDTTRSTIEFLKDEIKFQKWTHSYTPDTSGIKGETFNVSRLYYACLCNLRLAVRHFLAAGDDINAKVYPHGTPLHAAAYRSNLGILQLLLENGADINSKGNSHGGTALQVAASCGNLEAVQLLVENGADINTGGRYRPALQHAVYRDNLEVVQLLLENKADVNARADIGGTALQSAASFSSPRIVQLLLEHGADVNLQEGGTSPLGIASFYGNVEAVQVLLTNGADIEARNSNHCTALQSAASKNNISIVQLLLSNGADVNAPGGHHGGSPLTFAALGGGIEVVRLLLDHGANVHSIDRTYGTALQCASTRDWRFEYPSYRRPKAINVPASNTEIVQLLLDHGADVNAHSGVGDSALYCACSGGNIETVQLLLDKGADVNMVCGRGSALHAALFEEHLEIVQLLLENGADVNIHHADSGTPLQVALSRGFEHAAQMLRDKGACDREEEINSNYRAEPSQDPSFDEIMSRKRPVLGDCERRSKSSRLRRS